MVPPPDAPGLPDSEAIADRLADAVCAALSDCLGEQKLQAFVGRESCHRRFSRSLAQADLGLLRDSVERGRVRIDDSALDACYQDTRALGCAVQTQRLPAACQHAIQGLVAEGGTCSIGSDCAEGAFCSSGECPRTCTKPRSAGGKCERDEECEQGLVCTAGGCAQPGEAGAACAGPSGDVCGLGFNCVGGQADSAGVCKRNSEVQVEPLGAVCVPGMRLCEEGLSCAFDGVAGFVCAGSVEMGDACRLAMPSQCPNDAYCDAVDTPDGHCVALPTDGQACALGDECAAGHACVLDAAQQPVCRWLSNLGEGCGEDASCRSGRCADGQCAVQAVCE